jgi:hypothetical protein
LGSRGEAEKARELEAAAEKERLKAAAKAGTSHPPHMRTLKPISSSRFSWSNLQGVPSDLRRVLERSLEQQPLGLLPLKALMRTMTLIRMKKRGSGPPISVFFRVHVALLITIGFIFATDSITARPFADDVIM